MPKPKNKPSKKEINDGHIRRSLGKKKDKTKTSYWIALASGWSLSNKKEWEHYRTQIKRKKQNQQDKSGQKAKDKETSEKALKLSLIKSAQNKPTLTLPWIRHENYSKFENHFQQVGNDLKEHQGWYCLGTSELLSYVGMVGKWDFEKDEMYTNTIWLRWTDESRHKGHDAEDTKWPKGLLKNDQLKIDGAMAKVHTCTIASVNPNKEMKSRNPPVYNRNWSQHRLIAMVEDALIFLPAQNHRITPGRLYLKNSKDSFINKKSGGKPITIKNKKAMINAQSFDTFPRSRWYLGGDFNIKCSGVIPSQLDSIFGGGIHVKSVIDNLPSRHLRDGLTKK